MLDVLEAYFLERGFLVTRAASTGPTLRTFWLQSDNSYVSVLSESMVVRVQSRTTGRSRSFDLCEPGSLDAMFRHVSSLESMSNGRVAERQTRQF